MRKNKILLTGLVSLFLVGCQQPAPSTGSTAPASTTASASETVSTALKDFTGLTFTDQTVTYDGAKHSLTVGNLPKGATVSYSGKDYMDSGTYTIQATVTKDGYNAKTLKATLTIVDETYTEAEKAALGLTFEDTTYSYDGESHTLQVTGDLPKDSAINYTINGETGNSATETGQYTVIATIKVPNHKAFTLSAVLTIAAVEKTLYSTVIGSTVLFQNDLDNDTLYCYSSSLVKVSNDVIGGFAKASSVSFGISKSLFGTAVYSFSVGTDSKVTKTKVLEGIAVDMLAAVDDTHFYYSVHNLAINTADNGIYLYNTADSSEDFRGDKVVSGDYARKMVYANSTLYYINADRDIVSLSGTTKTTYLEDKNIYELVYNDGYLYYNKGSVAAKGLYRMSLSSKTETKLTIDNGVDLAVLGNALYYVNKDILATSLFGKGIYRVPLDGTIADTSGTQIVSGENDKIGSMTTDGTSLYYYRFNNAHFYKNATTGATETDLMAGYVKPEDTTLFGNAFNTLYKGELYYLNMHDNGCLYKYNFKTKQSQKILPYSVNNFFFYNDYLYFGSYVLTNYAEWRMSLTDHTITKISTDRCESLRFVDNTIYYMNLNAAKATLHSMALDGTGDQKIINSGLDPFSLEILNGKAYVIQDPALGYKTVESIDLTTKTETDTKIKAFYLVKATDNLLYLYDKNGKTIFSYNLSTTTTVVSSLTYTVSDLAYAGGKLYWQDQTNAKFYSLDGTSATLLASQAASSIVSDGTAVYFTCAQTLYTDNYPGTTYSKTASNGNLYSYANGTVSVLITVN